MCIRDRSSALSTASANGKIEAMKILMNFEVEKSLAPLYCAAANDQYYAFELLFTDEVDILGAPDYYSSLIVQYATSHGFEGIDT